MGATAAPAARRRACSCRWAGGRATTAAACRSTRRRRRATQRCGPRGGGTSGMRSVRLLNRARERRGASGRCAPPNLPQTPLWAGHMQGGPYQMTDMIHNSATYDLGNREDDLVEVLFRDRDNQWCANQRMGPAARAMLLCVLCVLARCAGRWRPAGGSCFSGTATASGAPTGAAAPLSARQRPRRARTRGRPLQLIAGPRGGGGSSRSLRRLGGPVVPLNGAIAAALHCPFHRQGRRHEQGPLDGGGGRALRRLRDAVLLQGCSQPQRRGRARRRGQVACPLVQGLRQRLL